LHWNVPCFAYSVHRAGSANDAISSDVLQRVVQRAFDTWTAADCGNGTHPSFYVEAYPQVDCEAVGYRSDGPNQNLWVFRDEQWEHEIDAVGALALTTLSIVAKTGEILDADVELNSYQNHFTVSNDAVLIDLESVVLHEAGHVTGIGHSAWTTSTMASEYLATSLEPRSLEADDIRAICAVMPPGELPRQCPTEPPNGFSTRCEFEPEPGCCSVAPHVSRQRGNAAALLLILLAIGRRSVRRRGAGIAAVTS
jgi:hypothetical protein